MKRADAEVAAFAARDQFSRLSAYLASRFGSLDDAEDALSSALVAALDQWPRDGVPDNPSAWLLAVARRRLVDANRRRDVRKRHEAELAMLIEEVDAMTKDIQELPDRRLGLMLACTHPAIDRNIQPALMLQTVLGLNAENVAAAFLVSGNTMGQRLARAKNKIRASGISFEVPDGALTPGRLGALLDAIYALFTAGQSIAYADAESRPLIDEAIFLAKVLATLVPDEPEVSGLLALLTFIEARRGGDSAPDFIPLSERPTDCWSEAKIEQAELLLKRAANHNLPGRFQIEAAIQSVHCARIRTGETEWSAIVALYRALLEVAPSVGAAVGAAAALSETGAHQAALEQLSAIEDKLVADYLPYWSVRAQVCARAGLAGEAVLAFDIATGLAIDPRHKSYLSQQKSRLLN